MAQDIWDGAYVNLGIGQPTLVAWQPEAVRKLSALVASEPLQTWKDYLRFHAINHSASLLPKAYADLRFGFYGTQLSGTTQQRDRWSFREFLRLDNIADRNYVGSVIVNEGNRRFFEPAPGRTWLLGASAAYAF